MRSFSLSLLFSSFCRPHDHTTPCRSSTCYPHALIFGWFDSDISFENNNPPSQLSFTFSLFPHTPFMYNISPHLFISSLLAFISSSLLRARAILTHATPQLHSQCLCSPFVCSSHISILLRWSPGASARGKIYESYIHRCECDVMITIGRHAFNKVRSSFPLFTFVSHS